MKHIGLFFLGILSPLPLLGSVSDLSFDYDIQADFLYAAKPDLENLNLAATQTSETTSSGGTRTLGLTKLSIGLLFGHKNSYFQMRLRPDASLPRQNDPDEVQLDYDSRSGSSYRSTSRIELLDSYEIGLLRTDSFKLKYGVIEKAFSERKAYDGPLDFGLEVWFPRKFASLGFHWKSQKALKNVLELDTPPQYQFSVFSLETSDDRHEKVSLGTETADTAPIASDPHTGVGGIVQYNPPTLSSYTLFAGYLDSKVDFGRKSRLMLAINSFHQFNVSDYKVSLSYGGRYSRERWNISSGNYPELEQSSHSLRSRLWLDDGQSVFAGISYGVSQRPLGSEFREKSIHDGVQLDLGFHHKIQEQLSLTLQLTDEQREFEEAGITNGGFQLENDSKNRLNRFGLKLSYILL